ncbi:class I SAM-dependent methyltransferase [Magnetospirillum sp. 64-120]|uniref:class I SAM-dependent methyltransferase n=1 Tax=Magnetospirillum sp. 64-120 TaxID=1895778 RepID=UPI0025C2F8A4|nr:class I SAM-dependent methyltransferase [Magnetospirillum sp. 64-120]
MTRKIEWVFDEFFEKFIIGHFRAYPEQVFRIPAFRKMIADLRFASQGSGVDIRKEAANTIQNGVDHNLAELKAMGDEGSRPEVLVRPLFSVDRVEKHAAEMKVLTIGPRTEAEIMVLVYLGFKLENICAIDLLSSSELVELGDVHDLKFADATFDVVVCGWVLPYSSNPARAIHEITRVLKPGGYAAIGCPFRPETEDELHQASGLRHARFYAAQDILSLFGDSIQNVIFKTEPAPEDRQVPGRIIAIVEKRG